MRARSLFGRCASTRADAVCVSFWPSLRTRSPVSVVDAWKRSRVCKYAPMSLRAWIEAGSMGLTVGAVCAPAATAASDTASVAGTSRSSFICTPSVGRRWRVGASRLAAPMSIHVDHSRSHAVQDAPRLMPKLEMKEMHGYISRTLACAALVVGATNAVSHGPQVAKELTGDSLNSLGIVDIALSYGSSSVA